MYSRYLLALVCFAGLTVDSRADWTVTILHPDGERNSQANACVQGLQAGSFATATADYRAALWSGSAASMIDLTPNGATLGMIESMTATHQGGWACFPSAPKAALWSGTKASFVNLHPAGFTSSMVHAVAGDKQYGEAFQSGKIYASAWSGTAASWVNLNPTGANGSVINDAYGDEQVGSFSMPHQTAAKWNGTPESCVSLAPDGSTNSAATCTIGTMQGGTAMFNGRFEAGIWFGTAASWVNLHPGNTNASSVAGITPSIQVGSYQQGGLYHACYWNGTKDSFVDLHPLLPAEYNESFATSVTSDGVTDTIVGYAENANNNRVAVMWTRPAEVGFTFSLNKVTVAGQNSVQGTIALAETSASDTVFTTYDNSSLIMTPPSVTVAANQTSKSFQIKVQAVNSSINTTLFAKRLSVTRSRPLTLTPLIPTAIAFTPNPVPGGNTVSCRIVVNGVAGPGGRIIAVFDNSPYTTMPSTVTVPPGATEVTFAIATTAVPSPQNALVTARVTAGEKAGILRIVP